MVFKNKLIDATERCPTSCTMSGQESVKRVACPSYLHSLTNEGEEWNLIYQETRVV